MSGASSGRLNQQLGEQTRRRSPAGPLARAALFLIAPLFALPSGCIIDNTPAPEKSPPSGGRDFGGDEGGEGGSAGDGSPAGAGTAAAGAAGASSSGGSDPSCNDTCTYANDGECDEPFFCNEGTDCSDCADHPDMLGYGTAPTTCEDTCAFAGDGYCDEPFLCDSGTDCGDCGYGAAPEDGAGGAGGETGATETGETPAISTDDTEPTEDPCGGVPVTGECVSSTTLRICTVPTSDALPTVMETACAAGSNCTVTAGRAACVALPDACPAGTASCADQWTLSECDALGDPQYSNCANGCRDTALGAFCLSDLATTTYEGTLHYEARTVNSSYTDFGSLSEVPAAGLLLVAKSGDDLVDAVTTADDGSFSINVPAGDAAEPIVAALFQPNAARTGPGVAVALPDVGDGEESIYAVDGSSATLWSFSIDPISTPSGSTLTVTEDQGSGAIRVFSNLREAYLRAESDFSETPRSLVVWLRMNTSWTCGACFSQMGENVGDQYFDSQIWIPAMAEDRSYWSDAVTLHETGHWAMASFGVNPGEGGRHCLGTPTFPGQGWSEGWATGYSAILRDNPRYYDKQDGTFFWSDIDAREFSGAFPWKRAVPSGGLYQKLMEDEISAMLWDLSDRLGPAALFAALESPRMTTSPFGRAYERTAWDPGGSYGCDQVNVLVTGTPAPMFADFLDALACNGASAATLDAVTSPDTHYPYDSSSPICD